MSASASSGGLKCRQRGCKENAPRACVAGKCPKHCDAGPDHGKCEGHVKRIRSAGGGSDRGHAGKAGKQRAHIFFTLIVEAVRMALEDHDDHHKQTLKEFNMTQDQATGQVVGEVRRRIAGDDSEAATHPIVVRLLPPKYFNELMRWCKKEVLEKHEEDEIIITAEELGTLGDPPAEVAPTEPPMLGAAGAWAHPRSVDPPSAATAASSTWPPKIETHVVISKPSPGNCPVWNGKVAAAHWNREEPPFHNTNATKKKRVEPQLFQTGFQIGQETASDYVAFRLWHDRPALHTNVHQPQKQPYIWDLNPGTLTCEPGYGAAQHAYGHWYRLDFDPWQPPAPCFVDPTTLRDRHGKQWKLCMHSAALHNLQQVARQGLKPGPVTGKGVIPGVFAYECGTRYAANSHNYRMYTGIAETGLYVGVTYEIAFDCISQGSYSAKHGQIVMLPGHSHVAAAWFHIISGQDLNDMKERDLICTWEPENLWLEWDADAITPSTTTEATGLRMGAGPSKPS